MFDSKIVTHIITLQETKKEDAYNKIKYALKRNEKMSFPSLQHRGKYVLFIEEIPSDNMRAYLYDNTGFVLFDDNYLISAIIEIRLRQIGHDTEINISLTPEPKPAKYTTLVSEEKTLEFDYNKIRIYWVDTIKKIRDSMRLENTKEVLMEMYPRSQLVDRLDNLSIIKEKLYKQMRSLVVGFQIAMILPLIGTFVFVYYDRGVYEWNVIWMLLLIGPIMYVTLYPFFWSRVNKEKDFVENILRKIDG